VSKSLTSKKKQTNKYLDIGSIFVFGLFIMMVLSIISGCTKGEKGDNSTEKSSQPVPPKAEKIKKELTLHDDTRVDYYYWLNQRDNPKVIEYLKAENKYLKTVMAHTEGLQQKIYDEIVGRIKPDDSTVPFKSNGYYYYTRYEKDKEYPIYCRRKENMENPEEILLDANEMAKGHAYFHVAGFRVSPDNTIIAYGVDTVSRRKYTIYFKNLVSGEIYPDKIPLTTGIAQWANDNKTVFYTTKDETTLRENKIFKHILGTTEGEDEEIFNETDETFSLELVKSKSKKYLFIVSYSTLSTEYRCLDADQPNGELFIIEPREKDHLYFVDHLNDRFYIRTNWEAKNFKLMETPVNKTGKENWQTIIPHRKDVLLESFELFKDYLALEERKGGLMGIRIKTWDGKDDYYIDFDEETYTASISINREIDTELLRYNYSSLTTPKSTFDFNMKNKEKKLLKQEEVLGDFDSKNYKAERLNATASDGTEVPISIVYRKGLEKDSRNPLLLYGYGSYGNCVEPRFKSSVLSLLDRGVVYAIAHIRGGGEMGRQWYEDGKLLKKINTFTDFIACAEYLVKEKFTNPKKLFAYGGSAGGLLMGAVANMRPDLFKGIIAAVPFVDVVTTMLDESIPLTTVEYDEWGNPNEKKYYDYMLSYSPYDNVVAQDYPAMLVLTGLHDSQVQYFEPAKWVAKLRELKTDNNLLLLRTDMEAGHGGASGRFKKNKQIALIYTFVLDQLGIHE